jgi:hypothetical protein
MVTLFKLIHSFERSARARHLPFDIKTHIIRELCIEYTLNSTPRIKTLIINRTRVALGRNYLLAYEQELCV